MYTIVRPRTDARSSTRGYVDPVEQAPISVRLAHLAQRFRRTNPALIDVLLATGLTVVAVVGVTGDTSEGVEYRETDAVAYLLTVATAIPYFVRRRAPLTVLVLSTIPVLALCAYEYTAGATPMLLLVGMYTVAAYADDVRRAVGAAFIAAALAFVWLVGTPGLDRAGIAFNYVIFAAAFFFGSTVRNRRLYTEQMEARAHAAEREREEGAHRAVADERLRIAQELHDVVAHSMGVIAVQAGVGAHVIDADPAEAKRSLEAISHTSRTTLTEIRRMLGALRDDDGAQYQPAPGLGELDRLVRDVGTALDIDVEIEGTRDDVPPGVDLTAYRIVQEALTNVLKHAGPATVGIRVCYEPDAVALEVTDDGRGVNGGATGGGHGLLGMRERVAVYGGSFEAGPRAGGGFRVTVRLPYGASA